MKCVKKLLLCLVLALSLASLGSSVVYADGVGDTGDTDQGNIGGGNTYTFYYNYDRSFDSIQLTVKTKNPINGFGNTTSHTFSSPSDSTTLNTSHPILGSSLDDAIKSMISQGGYDLTVAEVKTALNGLGYSDNGNGIWKTSGGYLTYVSCVKIRKKTHTVKYDANGGTGAPSSQTKKEGVTLTLRSGKPTRTGYSFVNWTASIGGNYNPSGSYTHDQDGGSVTMKANWVDNINPTGTITAVPNSWSAGNGTVTITAQDQGSGLASFTLNRYSYVTGTWATVSIWNLGGTTASTTKTYTETSEGVFYYSVTIKDVAGNSISASSAAIYLDHSSPVISGHGNTVTAWTKTAPTINVSATDYLSGTTYVGSGVKSLVIKDSAGNVVASGTSTARYTLASKYQGIVTWTIVATDNVGHTSTVYVTTKYDNTPPTCSEFSAVPNSWSAGNGTVKFTVQDAWSGISSVVLERYSYVTGTWTTVKTWSYSGQTSPVSGTYTETNEGVFYYRLTAKDTLGNTLIKTSAAIYLDHSNPVIYGLSSVVTDWTNIAPVINITTSDYLYGTTYTGSGVKSVVIKDDAGTVVASGTTSASYTLQTKYEGIHTWYVTIKDGVGHTSSGSVTTKYDITKPGIDGTEITFVTPDGQTVSGYCQDNIISQHIDDEASRSVNHPNCTSGLSSVIMYKVKNNVKTAVYSSDTQKTWGASDTHSSFNMYYDINLTEDNVDYYLVVAKDFAGNITTKKLTSQRTLLTLFHTSIDRSSY